MKRRAPEVIRKSSRARLKKGVWRRCQDCEEPFYTRWVEASLCARCAAAWRKLQAGSRGEPGSPLAS